MREKLVKERTVLYRRRHPIAYDNGEGNGAASGKKQKERKKSLSEQE